MNSSWLIFIALAVLALLFVVWPFIRRRQLLPASAPVEQDHLQTNIQLFREHMAELESALQDKRIDAEQFAQLKLEQERKLLDDEATLAASQLDKDPRRGAIVLGIVGLMVIALAAGLYQRWGSAPDVKILELQALKNQLDYEDLLADREPDEARAQELMAALDERLVQQPENSQYWFMLARTAMSANDFPRAINAYRQALAVDSESSIVMGELAQALFLRGQNRMTPEIEALAQAAVAREPKNTTALGLLGIAGFERKDFAAAVNYWQQAVNVMGAESPGSRALASGILRAKSEAAKAGNPLPDTPAVAARPIQVLITPGPELSGLPEDTTVFVYARTWQGTPMPLAIQRLTLGDLPQQVILDESMAMSPEMSLAQADQVEVVARVALDGSATPRAGDWQGVIGPLDLDDLPANISLTIDQKIGE